VKEIGERLRIERRRLGFTQAQVAAAAEVVELTQRNYESGKYAPPSDYLAVLAKLGVDVQFVITGQPGLVVSEDEADVLRRYRLADASARFMVTAALLTADERHRLGRPSSTEETRYGRGSTSQTVQADHHVSGALTLNLEGSNKRSRK